MYDARVPWTITRTAAPKKRAVDLGALKRSLRLSESDETHDPLLIMLIDSATEMLEHDTTQQLITAQFEYLQDGGAACDWISLPMRPLQSVELVSVNGEDITGSCVLDTGRRVITRNDGGSFAGTGANGIVVQFTAGYGDTFGTVPSLMRSAICLMAGKLFQNPTMTLNELITGGDRQYESIVARFLDTHVS